MSAKAKLDLSGVMPLHVVLTDAQIWSSRIVPLYVSDPGGMILTDRDCNSHELGELCQAMGCSDLTVEIVSPDELSAFIAQHYPRTQGAA